MERDELFKKIKIIVVIVLIIGLVGAIIFLIYGFALIWQAMAASVIIIFLAIITVLFLFISIYLGIKNLILKRELDKQQKEIERISHNLKNCNRRLREKKVSDE